MCCFPETTAHTHTHIMTVQVQVQVQGQVDHSVYWYIPPHTGLLLGIVYLHFSNHWSTRALNCSREKDMIKHSVLILCYLLWHVVELERRRLMERPSSRRLPTGRITLRTTVSLSSFITESRGTCIYNESTEVSAKPSALGKCHTALKSATSPSHGARPRPQLLGLLQSVFGRQ